MRALLIILLLGMAPGCAVLKKLKPQVDLQVQKAEGDANIAKLEGDIKELIDTINLQGNAIAGFKNDVNNLSAGRDITTTNDTDLMKDINEKWWLVFVGLIGLMKAQGIRDDKNHKKEIKRLVAEKKHYKDYFLVKALNTEQELAEFREAHEKIKNNA